MFSPCLCGLLQFPPTVQSHAGVELIGNSILPIDVNVSVDGCLTLCVN